MIQFCVVYFGEMSDHWGLIEYPSGSNDVVTTRDMYALKDMQTVGSPGVQPLH